MARSHSHLGGFLTLALVTGIIIASTSVSAAASFAGKQLVAPSTEYILQYGYPINGLGETYGPDTGKSGYPSPDLQLAENREGVLGYIRFSDIYDHVPDVTSGKTGRYINLYLQDGCTVIGSFFVSPGYSVDF